MRSTLSSVHPRRGFHNRHLLLSFFTSHRRGLHLAYHDVTCRDGLQSEAKILSPKEKLGLVKDILGMHPQSVEVCSFVREDKVPAMKGSSELCARLADDEQALLARKAGVSFAALVPNLKGFEKLLASRSILDTAVVLVSCSESHSKANVNSSIKDAIKNTLAVVQAAKEEGIKVRAYASLAFGCPFEGKVDPLVVQDVCMAYLDSNADVILLADTLGVGTPQQVHDLAQRVLKLGVPTNKLGFHFHDSHNKADGNVKAAFDLQLSIFDAAVVR